MPLTVITNVKSAHTFQAGYIFSNSFGSLTSELQGYSDLYSAQISLQSLNMSMSPQKFQPLSRTKQLSQFVYSARIIWHLSERPIQTQFS